MSALARVEGAAAASLILILSDINMPGMPWLEILPMMKALRPDVPVIMVTAWRRGDQAHDAGGWRGRAADKSDILRTTEG
jgi:CheY-like chemotaxis protein